MNGWVCVRACVWMESPLSPVSSLSVVPVLSQSPLFLFQVSSKFVSGCQRMISDVLIIPLCSKRNTWRSSSSFGYQLFWIPWRQHSSTCCWLSALTSIAQSSFNISIYAAFVIGCYPNKRVHHFVNLSYMKHLDWCTNLSTNKAPRLLFQSFRCKSLKRKCIFGGCVIEPHSWWAHNVHVHWKLVGVWLCT